MLQDPEQEEGAAKPQIAACDAAAEVPLGRRLLVPGKSPSEQDLCPVALGSSPETCSYTHPATHPRETGPGAAGNPTVIFGFKAKFVFIP